VNDVVWALLMGGLQGATEFLPVSSSGHLLILFNLRSVGSVDHLSFITFLHLGTLLAVVLFVYKDMLALIRALRGFVAPLRSFKRDPDFRVLVYLLTSTIITGVLGIFLETFIDRIFSSLSWQVGLFYLLLAVILFASDRMEGTLQMHQMGFSRALLLGLLQSAALLPGISRSGITIFAGLLLGMRRVEALRYSFLLSVPVTAGAGLLKLSQQSLDAPSIVALFTSMSVGLFALAILKKTTLTKRLSVFGCYCAVLGISIILGVNLL